MFVPKEDMPLALQMVAEYVEAFERKVDDELNRLDKVDTGDLASSIRFETTETANGIIISVFVNDYYKFVDKGVRGKGQNNINGTSPYKFRTINPSQSQSRLLPLAKPSTRRDDYRRAQSSAATIYGSIAKGIADSFGVMRSTPNRLLVANTGGEDGIDFAGLLGAVDGSGRPLYAAAAPSNANGLITQGSTAGSVAGLGLVVDANYTGDDANAKHALVYPSNAMRFHESNKIELRANVVANGQVEIGLYAYVCVVNRYPAAFRKLNVAYWRKNNAVHKWFVDNLNNGEDDCQEYYVPRGHLQERCIRAR